MSEIRMAAIVINAVEPDRVADFWKALLEVGERQRIPGFVWLERSAGSGVSLAVQHVEEPTEGRNRMHLDFGATDIERARRRVIDLGGTEVERHAMGDFEWVVFADPEGNEFCVAQADPDEHA